ncbi:1,4-dihydroxy-2-naphthoyl-CoA hydrolase [Roseimaritima multifibrata]|uniref:1,4-dihydroxy-2-naphthoyl-CoA hydrolase n=1 Tax=Roseimaritima multifibrata TaxID=1930274 RepID=A0A517MCP9_9BACT|nr:thioesterase family protein [Roseimaritima multifibrata]QDS92670.1 1,4-dihydroxy-2-naphthoyl-CoA hydrolase [Roseimaritima multifibrata]
MTNSSFPIVSDGSDEPSEPSFVTKRRVEFRDTDAAGIVHFSAFFPMMESAEHAFLRASGLSVMQEQESGGSLTWPRVAASCDYLSAARFEDVLQIALFVDHLGTKSVRYRFEFSRDGQPIAVGKLTAVCCHFLAGKLTSVVIPDSVREAISTPVRDS